MQELHKFAEPAGETVKVQKRQECSSVVIPVESDQKGFGDCQNGQNWAKSAKNEPKWPEIIGKTAKNGSKKAKNDLKMAKNSR